VIFKTLEASKEVIHYSVVPAITFSAHTLSNVILIAIINIHQGYLSLRSGTYPLHLGLMGCLDKTQLTACLEARSRALAK